LYPPAAIAFGIQNDPLFWANAGHPSCDGVHVVQTAYGCQGNFGEFDGRLRNAALTPIKKEDAEKQKNT
jgi:hypothetical protein